jgi:hypothetical protein
MAAGTGWRVSVWQIGGICFCYGLWVALRTVGVVNCWLSADGPLAVTGGHAVKDVYEVRPEYRAFVEPFVQAVADCNEMMLWEYDATVRKAAYVGGVEQALIRCAGTMGAALGLDETELYRAYDRVLAEVRKAGV